MKKEFRTLTQTSPMGIAVSSRDGRIIYANLAYAAIMNYQPAELLEQPSTFVYYDAAERQAWLQDMKNKGAVSNREIRFRRKDGSPVWVVINVATDKSIK